MKTTVLLFVLLLAVAGSHGRKTHARLQRSDDGAVPEAEAKSFVCSGGCYGFFGGYGYMSWQCSGHDYGLYHVQTGCFCCFEYYEKYVCSGGCLGFYGYNGYLSYQCGQYGDYFYDRFTGCYCCV